MCSKRNYSEWTEKLRTDSKSKHKTCGPRVTTVIQPLSNAVLPPADGYSAGTVMECGITRSHSQRYPIAVCTQFHGNEIRLDLDLSGEKG
jgi:hypothetical protein